MFTYAKALIALGLAVVVVAGTGLWFRHLAAVSASLSRERLALEQKAAEARAYPAMIDSLEKRVTSLTEEIAQMAGRFADKDNPGPQLVTTVVKSAGAAQMEMTHTTENVPAAKAIHSKLTPSPDVKVISYEFGLRGAYSSLVQFLQNMASWKLAHKIESLDITCPQSAIPQRQVETILVLSVFSSDKLDRMPKTGAAP